MKKDLRIELRVDEELIKRIDQWGEENSNYDMSRSDVIRTIIKQNTEKFYLTKEQRVITLLCLNILKEVDAKENFMSKKEIDKAIKALLNGHNWALDEILSSGLVKPDSEANVEFVYKVLNIFTEIKNSIDKLDKQDVCHLENLEFKGFDPNTETELFGITLFIIQDMDKFKSLNLTKEKIKTYRIMEPLYRKILKKYKELDVNKEINSNYLTKEQLEYLNNI